MMEWQIATYSGLGVSVLGLCAWIVWNLARRASKRANSEGDIDDRVVKMIDVISKSAVNPLSDMLAEERQEKRRAQDERDKITQKFIEYTGTQQKFFAGEVQKLRDEHKASIDLINGRLEQCDESHLACNSRLTDALKRLDAVETMNAVKIAVSSLVPQQSPQQ